MRGLLTRSRRPRSHGANDGLCACGRNKEGCQYAGAGRPGRVSRSDKCGGSITGMPLASPARDAGSSPAIRTMHAKGHADARTRGDSGSNICGRLRMPHGKKAPGVSMTVTPGRKDEPRNGRRARGGGRDNPPRIRAPAGAGALRTTNRRGANATTRRARERSKIWLQNSPIRRWRKRCS